jgi:hypothetical protein
MMTGNEVFKVAVKTLDARGRRNARGQPAWTKSHRLADPAPGQPAHHRSHRQAPEAMPMERVIVTVTATATRPRDRCRWRWTRRCARARCSAARPCCWRPSAAASPGARRCCAIDPLARWHTMQYRRIPRGRRLHSCFPGRARRHLGMFCPGLQADQHGDGAWCAPPSTKPPTAPVSTCGRCRRVARKKCSTAPSTPSRPCWPRAWRCGVVGGSAVAPQAGAFLAGHSLGEYTALVAAGALVADRWPPAWCASAAG